MIQVLLYIMIAFAMAGVIEIVSGLIDRRQKERAERQYWKTHYLDDDTRELWL